MRLSRRGVLSGGLSISLVSMATAIFPMAAHARDRGSTSGSNATPNASATGDRPPSATSLNGWTIDTTPGHNGTVYARPIPNVPVGDVMVCIGGVEWILAHLVERYHHEVEELRDGDVIGWFEPDSVGMDRAESNLASGTALRIRQGHCPPGQSGGFFPAQEVAIRDILADLSGAVRWGGDDKHVDESLFYIDVGPTDKLFDETASAVQTWVDTPGAGARMSYDAGDVDRRRRAVRLQKRQRATT